MPAQAAGPATAATGVVYTNAKTGKSSPYGTLEAANDVYVDKDGHIFSDASGHWQQHSTEGWVDAAGDTAWADREARARRAGEEAFRAFSQAPLPAPAGDSPR